MRKIRWALCLWPGLPQLWLQGRWGALGAAVAASFLLNLFLVASFAWDELIGSPQRSVLWGALGIGWVASGVASGFWIRRHWEAQPTAASEDRFAGAVEEYLKGNYFQAERLLVALLRENAGDLEARLMLATLLRHLGRLREAAGELDALGRFEGVKKWELEIRRERILLAEAGKAGDAKGREEGPPSRSEMTHAA